MNFFKSEAQVKAGKTLRDQAEYVRRGGSLRIFKPEEINALQEWALDVKDIKLYDYLNKYWAQA